MNQGESFKAIKRVLILVLILNWGVAVAKVILGFLTRSTSIMADGLHSFSDGSSNIVGIVGIAMASRPKDKDHPYGHGKMENFAAIGIAMMLFMLALEILRESVETLRSPRMPEINAISFVVMAGTILVNYMVTRYEFRRGKELKSDILVADSFHTKTDIYVSFAVIAGMIGIKLGFPRVDPIMSLFIVFMIGRMAVAVLRHTSYVLCDKAVIDSQEISAIAMMVKGVKNCHQIRTRGREDQIMVDLHINVDESMRVGDAHDLADKIEDAVKAKFAGVSEVIVHIEPETRKKWKR